MRRLDWLTVLCMTGLAAGCGEVTLQAPSPDASNGPGPVDATPGPPIDATLPDPRVDAGVPDAAPSDPSLIAWYPLDSIDDGFTEDVSGNQRHAECVPTRTICPELVPGQVGMAMAFGDFKHLRVNNGDGFFDTPDGFTIAAWARIEDRSDGAVISKMLDSETTTKNSWQIEYSEDGRPAFTTANEGTHDVNFADDPVDFGTWVHLVGTWDGTTKRLYIDGVLEYELPFVVAFDGSDFVIGADENNGAPALEFEGSIDEVRIYDRALDQDEIDALVRAR